jgi:cobalamin-dependent methionine synthase I
MAGPARFLLIGELLNPSYARARRAFEARDLERCRELALHQARLGAGVLSVNLGAGREEEERDRLEFLARLVPALQEAVDLPLSFDSPRLELQERGLAAYDRAKARGEPALVNSLAPGREAPAEWIRLIRAHGARVVVMAAGPAAAGPRCAMEVVETACALAERLRSEAGRRPEDLFIDPGLPPFEPGRPEAVRASLEALALLSGDPRLRGCRRMVGLSNLSCRLPREERTAIENAYLTLALRAGLDTVLGNPERRYRTLPEGHPALRGLEELLGGRGRPGAWRV